LDERGTTQTGDWILRHISFKKLTCDTDAPGEKALAEAKNKAEKATEKFILLSICKIIYFRC
jgi:hypothetical protein